MFCTFFPNFNFWDHSGRKGQKMAQNDKNLLSDSLCMSGTIPDMIVFLVLMCKIMIPP